MNDTEVKRHLRAAHRADPEAFDALLREYQERGPEAFAAPKPGTNAGKPGDMHVVRALLLARTMNRTEQGESERAVLRDVADNADFWKNHQTGNFGVFDNFETTKTHLRAAKQKYKTDPKFREDVDFYRWALTELG
ncbi:hypothetical protein [Thioalkalivibrio sp. AKL12]|uniref:hypothetical protein n=1 Tax=Thioalkalivibrio sp. AKL12 TaxID=1158159 RepID=UPI0003633309|nr:hypothetical protein [Thioalkalivibrio sp. AKL12]